MLHRRGFIGGIGALAGAPALAAEGPVLTLDYGSAKLDIHTPTPGAAKPVLLYVHGGAWQIGSRRDVDAKPDLCRRLGWLFVSADYRLAPFVRPARQEQDVAAAFAFVKANIAAQGGDPERIIVIGHSAGCHLAALTALKGDMPGVAGLILNDIQMYDIAKFASLNGGHLPRHYGYLFGSGDKWQNLSPASHIGDAPIPPVLIAWSKMPLSREMSQEFAARLQAAGADVATFDGVAYNHMDINRLIGAEEGGITAAVTGFLRRFG